MATIGDDLRARARRYHRWTFGAASALMVLLAVAASTHRLPERTAFSWSVLILLAFFALDVVFLNRILCTKCGTAVGFFVSRNAGATRCPQCSAAWDEPFNKS
jgi:hypothetical protein